MHSSDHSIDRLNDETGGRPPSTSLRTGTRLLPKLIGFDRGNSCASAGSSPQQVRELWKKKARQVAVPGAIDRARIRVPKVWALYLQHPDVGVNGTLGLFRGHSTTPRIPTCTRRPMPLRNRPKLRARSNGRRRRTVFRIFSVRIEARETKWLNSGGRCWDRTSDPCLASNALFQSRRSFSSASLAAPPYALASRRNKFVSSARPSDSIARRASVKS